MACRLDCERPQSPFEANGRTGAVHPQETTREVPQKETVHDAGNVRPKPLEHPVRYRNPSKVRGEAQ